MWTLGLLIGNDGPDGGCGGCLFDIIFWGFIFIFGYSIIKVYWILILLLVLVIFLLKVTNKIIPGILILVFSLFLWPKRRTFGMIFNDLSNLGWYILAALLVIFAWMIIDANKKDKKK